jgi:ABC-2 type transport system permease protein
MQKIKTIIRKEWAEVFKNRMVLFTVAFLPLIMTALPLIIMYTMRGESSMEAAGELPDQMSMMCPADLSSGECLQVYLVGQFMMLFMMVPLAIPATIASYSIVGEKTTHSLEPLLATPITTMELLAAKSLSAVIPAVVATYGAFGIYAVGAWIILQNPAVFKAMMDARWLLAVFLLGPLLGWLAVSISTMVSSRVNDPRVAEQVSMIVVLPVIAFFIGQMGGLFTINRNLVLVASAVMVVIDALLTYAMVQMFQRETILTRWK